MVDPVLPGFRSRNGALPDAETALTSAIRWRYCPHLVGSKIPWRGSGAKTFVTVHPAGAFGAFRKRRFTHERINPPDPA
jgi:hypothetical protein